jgi:hypothetical protein
MNMKQILWLILAMSLSACGTAELATPAPTSEAIQVFYPSSFQFWANSIANCAANNPLIALYFLPAYSTSDIHENDIILDIGQATRDNGKTFLSQVGWDQVVVLVNTANPAAQLSKDELNLIFSGQVTKWKQRPEQPIQVWVLPDGEPARRIFDDAILSSQGLNSEAHLAPDVDTMLEVISQNTDAIGYLPESFLNSSDSTITSKVKIILLESSLEAELHQPVIAITKGEPTGLLRNVLVCLQNTGK